MLHLPPVFLGALLSQDLQLESLLFLQNDIYNSDRVANMPWPPSEDFMLFFVIFLFSCFMIFCAYTFGKRKADVIWYDSFFWKAFINSNVLN